MVWLGSAAGQAQSRNDTTVVATVAPAALSGIARIQQNGLLSNASYFLVQVPGGNPVTLMPSLLNMVVGDTHNIQALGANGLPVTGLAWTSSDPTVVSLSPSDPPVLTALAAGHVTITAGGASADVTVWDPSLLPGGALPLGTVLWSNPGDGSGVQSIVPAVPSTSGVADVFAFQADGTVQAITSDGTTAWTATAGGGIPDFQGGLVVVTPVVAGQSSIYKLDGITGQPYPAYTVGGTTSLGAYGGSLVAVHPDGTIFAVQQNFDPASYSEWDSVIGIDPTTGAQKFSVDLDSWPGFVWGIMIAGDGNAYVAYSSREYGPPGSYIEYDQGSYIEYDQLKLLQVNSSGDSASIEVYDWEGGSDDITDPGVSMITNADQGVLLTWSGGAGGMAVTAGTSASIVGAPQVPGGGSVAPVLQAQDGSFVGTFTDPNTYNNDMVAFDATGATRWTVPNETPQIATADGGVIGQSGITYDQNGNATGMIPNMPTQSWMGNAYTDGPVDSVAAALVDVALSFNAFADGSPSPNGTAVKLVRSPMFIPFAVTGVTTANSYDITPAQRADVATYFVNTVGYLGPTQLALYPLPFERATAARFLGALGTTNTIVGYIDHGLIAEDQGQTNARALCFWRWCLAPAALTTWTPSGPTDPGLLYAPVGAQLAVLPNGFAPKAKVVFLAACGIDAGFIAQWHIGPGQALIVPKYNDDNPTMLIDLNKASNEWEAMLLKLGKGGTVGDAVAFGNQQAAHNQSDYSWQVIGDGSVNFNAKTQ